MVLVAGMRSIGEVGGDGSLQAPSAHPPAATRDKMKSRLMSLLLPG